MISLVLITQVNRLQITSSKMHFLFTINLFCATSTLLNYSTSQNWLKNSRSGLKKSHVQRKVIYFGSISKFSSFIQFISYVLLCISQREHLHYYISFKSRDSIYTFRAPKYSVTVELEPDPGKEKKKKTKKTENLRKYFRRISSMCFMWQGNNPVDNCFRIWEPATSQTTLWANDRKLALPA